jgi:ABC-type phosphate transport system substrate-binding protein
VGGDADVVGLVGGNPNMIGYVDASAVNDSVKVVATLK